MCRKEGTAFPGLSRAVPGRGTFVPKSVRQLIFLQLEVIVAGAKKMISNMQIIMSRSNYIASAPDLIVFEEIIIIFNREIIVSKMEIIISTRTKTA